MDKDFSFQKKDYEYTWGGTGFTLLFQSLFAQAMKSFPFMDTFFLSKDNELRVYISRSALVSCSQYGKEYLRDREKVIELCEQTHTDAQKLLDHINHENDISLSWEEFNAFSKKFLFEYSKLDPYFSDEPLSELSDQEILLYLGEQKNNLREKLNAIYFTDDSVLISLLTAVGAQFSVAVEDLHNSTSESISMKLEDSSNDLLYEKDYIVYTRDGIVSHAFDEEIIRQMVNEFAHGNEVYDEVITGTSVSKKGIYRGIVNKVTLDYTKLDETISAINNGKEGLVLVADHTTPELLPIMKKSIAIITDMGGLLSHASITSRELGIPCIVGTKIGTQVLKDGDLVEVDADRGVIEILKRTDN